MHKYGSFLDFLQCTSCSREYDPNNINNLCNCGKVLFAHYDLNKAKETITYQSLQSRSYNIWRFPELMPVLQEKNRLTLGEGWTPLIQLNRLNLNLKNVFLKDEGLNPTGTFKSRGLCAAVSKAVELGIKELVIPTAGNAGAALAAYASRAGIKSHIFMPTKSSLLIQKEITSLGGELVLIDGLINDAGKIAKEKAHENNWFNVSTLKEPYRVEGKKTMGFEIAEQFSFQLPDAIIYPTGGGTGIVGMWKAFDELEQCGLIDNARPKMISVQASGCAPIVKAYKENLSHASVWEDAKTFASGLRVPSAIGDYLILESIKKSNGTAVSVTDDEIRNSMYFLAKKEGIMLAPEAAATVSALQQLQESNYFDNDDKIVLFGTGSGLTTPNEW